MTKPSELHAYFMTKVIPLLGQKSKPIVWQVCTISKRHPFVILFCDL